MALAERQAAKVRVAKVQLVFQAAWHAPAQLVVAEVQICQVGEVTQLRPPRSTRYCEGQQFKFGEAAQLRRYLPAQLGRGCPTTPVSPRSRRFLGGTDLPGWRGCPAPPVSRRSSLLLKRPDVQHCQVGEAAQLRRYLPAQVVALEVQRYQVGEAAQLRRQLPAQVVALEVQRYQVGEAAQLRRYLPAQVVAAEAQMCPGWRGCPAPPVSPRSSSWCRGPAV